MAILYPTTIDTFTNPAGTSLLPSPDHALQHGNANDAIVALETKVGVNNDAGTASFDYRIRALETTNNTGYLNVKDYGALGNGTADDTAAFGSALADTSNPYVFVPPGTYNLTGITISQNYAKFVGAGSGATKLQMTNAGTACITVGSFLTNIEISNMTLTRNTTATSGGDGISWDTSTSKSLIKNLIIDSQYNGMTLQGTDFSSVFNVTIEKCQNDGIVMKNNASISTLQWSLDTILLQKNVGYGIHVTSITGPASITLGTWRFVNTFANTAGGLSLNGLVGTPINGLRLYESFIGADNGTLIYLDTYGTYHTIRDCFLETAGQNASGPTLSTAATSEGSGITVSANNTNVEISNCRIHSCSWSGIDVNTQTTVNGCYISNCGLALFSGERSGITLAAGSLLATGNRITNDSGTTQLYGIYLNVDAGVVVGNYLAGNVTSGLQGAGTASVDTGNKKT